MALQKVDVSTLSFNPFQMIGKQWALLGAGDADKFNMMTVSWGGIGVLWTRPTVSVYVRESRYTKTFIDNGDTFVLTFLEDGHRDVLNTLGSKSGRDMDKMHDSGLTPVAVEGGVTFEEAELAFVCRKLYALDMPAENFICKDILSQHYANGDYHTMYVGEIIGAYKKA